MYKNLKNPYKTNKTQQQQKHSNWKIDEDHETLVHEYENTNGQ